VVSEVNVILGYLCIRALWTRLQTIGRDASQRRPATLSVVSAIIFLVLATLFVCAQVACAVIQYVDSRDPTALAASDSATALNELANASSVLAMTLADGLLVRSSTSRSSTQLNMAIIALARVYHLE
jgi:hypothetical protein